MRKQVIQLNMAFSIVELMTILGIVSILLALVVPSYEIYIVKTRLTNVAQDMYKYLDAAKESYANNQTIPSSVLGASSGTYLAVTTLANITYVYYNNGSSWANVGKAATVQAVVGDKIGNAVSGYVSGTSGTHNVLTVGFVINSDGIVKTYCGKLNNNASNIPAEYLPSGCSDDNFESLITG